MPPRAELGRRLPRLFGGLVLFGVAIACMARADLGLPPWDVLHQGVAERTGLAIGHGVDHRRGGRPPALDPPSGAGRPRHRRQRPHRRTRHRRHHGLVQTPASTVGRVGLLVFGIVLFGPGSGLYIGAGLGPGPRDGLMTALARRGRSVRVVRTAIELTVLGIGVALGGSVGIGTVAFAVTVGPNVHLFLDRMKFAPPEAHPPTTPALGTFEPL